MRSRRALPLVLLLLAGCGSGEADLGATADTARIAAVEAAHLCQVQRTSYRTEGEIGAGLDELLAAEGLDHDDWRRWRDSLADAPARAAQLAEATATGC